MQDIFIMLVKDSWKLRSNPLNINGIIFTTFGTGNGAIL